MSACGPCLGRAWLLRELAGHLEHTRGQIEEVLALTDRELIAAIAGRRRRELERRLGRLRPERVRREACDEGLGLICRCDARYPGRLRELRAPPALLFVSGDVGRFELAAAEEPVAVVGSRRASGYGLEVARSLSGGLAAAGLTVVSGMALGVDSAAHEGALAAGFAGIAVLPGSAGKPYPSSRARLHRQLTRTGVAISEFPPGTPVRRWMFIARNRIIAALCAATVVVEASARSGALVTATVARELGRPVGAVPGRITTPQAAGTNDLLAHGAFLVRGAQDVLDAVYGTGVRDAGSERRPEPPPDAREVLRTLAADGHSPDGSMSGSVPPGRTLAALAWLELNGYITRAPGGRFAIVP